MAGRSASRPMWRPRTVFYEDSDEDDMKDLRPTIDNDRKWGRRSVYPRLPLLKQCCLDEYDPLKVFKNYSERDLGIIARRTDARAKARLRDTEAFAESTYDFREPVETATVAHKVLVQERKTKKIMKQIEEMKSKMCDAFHIDYIPDEGMKVFATLKASQIAKLLSETMGSIDDAGDTTKRIGGSKEIYDTYSHSGHLQWMQERAAEQAEEEVSIAPIKIVKKFRVVKYS